MRVLFSYFFETQKYDFQFFLNEITGAHVHKILTHLFYCNYFYLQLRAIQSLFGFITANLMVYHVHKTVASIPLGVGS
jgi:hypothetical protein